MVHDTKSPKHKAHQKRRLVVDAVAGKLIGLGGISVIIAITLIFFYLLTVVFPLFHGAELHKLKEYSAPGTNNPDAQTLYLAMEEQGEVGLRVTNSGELIFFKIDSGEVIQRSSVALPKNVLITSFAASDPSKASLAFGLSNGQAIVVKHKYNVSYPNNTRVITPEIEQILGADPIMVDRQGEPLVRLAFQTGDSKSTLVAFTDDNRLLVTTLTVETSFLSDEVSVDTSTTELPAPTHKVLYLLLDRDQRIVYAANKAGTISRFDVSNIGEPELTETASLIRNSSELTALRFLSGGISLLAGTSDGRIMQWMAVRDEVNQYHLTKIRELKSAMSDISALTPEFFRKGMIAGDSSGKIGLFYATSERELVVAQTAKKPIRLLAISPRANKAIIEDGNNTIHVQKIDNEHPEVSWSALWQKVWYEGYDEPKYIWQSSSASNDFEPKLSLVPLSFGTLKAAFYAMLLATPLAIMGAIFTAYFMAPRLRQTVKPTIEVMEALPTVILGFLAGLWLAPFLEKYLPGFFTLCIVLPLGTLLFAYLWSQISANSRFKVPEGWHPVLLIPVVIILSWISFAASPFIEQAFFGGDMPHWFRDSLGIDFDQRNAMVVGLAMGFAVIPTIFSIAEDAIFSVPKHLTMGSLALGATPWQTFVRVVILTASPGIFSAVMIGFGRAVGETMIVLMATGNTPVLDLSLFQGMRTLSANIAVEMPESEVNSSHYRVLFLAALVLFVFTFFFNTIAELVRQRLRKKYSSL